MKDKLELQKQYIEVKNKYDELSEKYWSMQPTETGGLMNVSQEARVLKLQIQYEFNLLKELTKQIYYEG